MRQRFLKGNNPRAIFAQKSLLMDFTMWPFLKAIVSSTTYYVYSYIEIVLNFDQKTLSFKQEVSQIEIQVYSAFGYINVTKDLCVNCLFQLDEDSINVISIDT